MAVGLVPFVWLLFYHAGGLLALTVDDFSPAEAGAIAKSSFQFPDHHLCSVMLRQERIGLKADQGEAESRQSPTRLMRWEWSGIPPRRGNQRRSGSWLGPARRYGDRIRF
jgi:hypothetical protein